MGKSFSLLTLLFRRNVELAFFHAWLLRISWILSKKDEKSSCKNYGICCDINIHPGGGRLLLCTSEIEKIWKEEVESTSGNGSIIRPETFSIPPVQMLLVDSSNSIWACLTFKWESFLRVHQSLHMLLKINFQKTPKSEKLMWKMLMMMPYSSHCFCCRPNVMPLWIMYNEVVNEKQE